MTPLQRKSAYIWYYNGSRRKAQQIADTGAEAVLVKAGGDRGIAWVPGAPNGGFAVPQWHTPFLQPLLDLGLACVPWTYPWPVVADQDVVLPILRQRWSDVLVINPETEWRVQSQHSPYRRLADGNAYAAAYVRRIRELVRTEFGREIAIGYSTCPSWHDFPVEGFEQACDFSMPQSYWPDNLMAPDGETGEEAGEDMVEAHLRRCGKAKPCYPILTACREYDDAGVIALAIDALDEYPDLAGLSSWEAGNASYQADAMRRAYLLLPPAPETRTRTDAVAALRGLLTALAR